MIELQIINEFRDLVPELTKEEFAGLTQSIKKEGCRDKLLIWNNILIDGHNRYKICTENDIEFKTKEMKFENNINAKKWILSNSLNRRNLTPYQKSLIALQQEKIYEQEAKERMIKGKADPGLTSGQGKANEKLAKIAKVSRDTIAKVKKIEEQANDKDKQLLRIGKKSINSVYQQIKRIEKKDVIKQMPQKELEGKYNVILADPPWQYDNQSTSFRGQADNHYLTVTQEDLINLPIKNITLDNSVIFLWTTSCMFFKGLQLLEAWGFVFKTSMVWVKDRIGTGFYVRSKHEIILIGVKGNFTPMTTNLPGSVFEAKKEKHSKKPEILHKIIEQMYPEQKYIELFARKKYNDKWAVWGNEI